VRNALFVSTMLSVVPGILSAQTEAIQKQVSKSLEQARMYEDIEIMRRLLHRKIAGLARSCAKCHRDPGDMAGGMGDMDALGGIDEAMGAGAGGMAPGGGGMAGMPGMPGMAMGPMPGAAAARDEAITVDGVYVPGHGVVFQVEAPRLLAMLPPAIASPQPKAELNEWELIRRQLRGEKVRQRTTAKDPHQPSFQEALTATLAEYGKNFRALKDTEKLTVAVTFRAPASEPAAGGGAMSMGGMMPGGAVGPMGGGFDAGGDPMGGLPGLPGGGVPTLPMPGGEGGVGDFASGGPGGFGSQAPGNRPATTSKDHELLADYHIRQGRYDEASKSLLKAFALNTDVKRSSGLQRKLAIAYLMRDQYDRSDPDAVAKALAAINKAAEKKKPAATPAVQPLVLPQRLIITVSRHALQSQSLEGATIEWLRFDRQARAGESD
jgi:hypothetical protein